MIGSVQNIMDEWLTCQGKWLYLEPIFSADEIMKQIPREGSAFRMMDASWRKIAQQVRRAAPVNGMCSQLSPKSRVQRYSPAV